MRVDHDVRGSLVGPDFRCQRCKPGVVWFTVLGVLPVEARVTCGPHAPRKRAGFPLREFFDTGTGRDGLLKQPHGQRAVALVTEAWS
ncbi:MAG: hypothetical protein QOK49_1814 [Baekduia sp.]|jgi:hypothetical protein|nr:hypothetical protein [Baekduia sp.]